MTTAVCRNDRNGDHETSRVHFTIEQFLQEASEVPGVRAVFERAVLEMSRRLSPHGSASKKLERSVSGLVTQSDPDLLANLVIQLISSDHYVSPEARVRLRGQQMFNDMLKQAGGLYSQEEVAGLLSVTVAAVRKRQQNNRLIGVLRGDHRYYPVWQFEDGGMVPHLEDVLQLLDVDDASKVRFFLTPDGDLKQRPIDALRKQEHLDLVKRKARQFGKQIAT